MADQNNEADNQADHDPDLGPWDDSWTTLPAPQRREHVLAEIAEGRWLGLLRSPIDSDLLDVIAAVRAIQDDNNDALSVIIGNGNVAAMLVTSLKMISEAAADQGIPPDFLGVWGSWALVRSS